MKKGFTLAEVLITLGVIGVVAAITIPNLIQNYKKHVLENRLKQTVSILQQAVVRSSVDNGTPDTWGIGDTQSNTFDTYLKPYLQIVKTCKGAIADKNDICNSKIDYINNTGYVYNMKYILNNGSSIIFTAGWTGTTNFQRRGTFFIIPQNKKEDLIYGKNVFSFNLIIRDSITYSITSTKDYNSNLNFCKLSKSRLNDFCTKGDGSDGYARGIGCSALIECNGWKFPDDYPIRL